MIILRHTGMVIKVSQTILELLGMTLPKRKSIHQLTCVLPSLYRIQMYNRTLHKRMLTHLKMQACTLQLALLKPSTMNGLTKTPFVMYRPLDTSKGSRYTICTSQIYRFP